MKKIITKSEKETFDFAKNFASDLRGGEIIGLEGDLGAGKTIFTRGLAAGLNIKKNVTSPTFVVMKIYEVTSHPNIKTLCHIDAYKISDSEVEAFGIIEYLGSNDTVTIIEWINNIKNSLPTQLLIIKIKEINKHTRKISIKK